MNTSKTKSESPKLSKVQRRYYRLKEEGKCVECAEPNDNGKAYCNQCLGFKRKQSCPTLNLDGTVSEDFKISRSGGYCTTPLRLVLASLKLRIRYSEDKYQFSGSQTFTWKRKAGDTPFDALRAEGLI